MDQQMTEEQFTGYTWEQEFCINHQEVKMYRFSGKNYKTFEEAMQALMELVPEAGADRLVELSDLLIWDIWDGESLT